MFYCSILNRRQRHSFVRSFVRWAATDSTRPVHSKHNSPRRPRLASRMRNEQQLASPRDVLCAGVQQQQSYARRARRAVRRVSNSTESVVSRREACDRRSTVSEHVTRYLFAYDKRAAVSAVGFTDSVSSSAYTATLLLSSAS